MTMNTMNTIVRLAMIKLLIVNVCGIYEDVSLG